MSVKFLLSAGTAALLVVACQPADNTSSATEPTEVISEERVWDKGTMIAAADPRAV